MQVTLRSDQERELCDQNDWNSADAIGMSLHVSNNTCPEMTFVVGQAARFIPQPAALCARAIKSIRHSALSGLGIVGKEEQEH